MYTNTNHIFLAFQQKWTETLYNKKWEQVDSLQKAPDNDVLTVWENVTGASEVLSNFGIKGSFAQAISQTKVDILNQEGSQCTFVRQKDPKNPEQEVGTLTVRRKLWNEKMGKPISIPVPPEKLFQNTYTFPNFDFIAMRSPSDDSYILKDKNNKEAFRISSRNIDNFQREIYKITLDMMSEAYDVDDSVDELIKKAGETGNQMSPEKIKDIKQKLSQIDSANIAQVRKAMKALSQELADEDGDALKNAGVSRMRIFTRPEESNKSDFPGIGVMNQDMLWLPTHIDLDKLYQYVGGKVVNYQYDTKTLETIGAFLVDNFNAPQKK